MICPKCNGVGRIPFGEEPEIFSEEEWLRQATTEQLAEFLAEIINTNPCGYLLSCNECGLNNRCREDDYPSSKESWGEWLKQPHAEKE